MGAADGSIVLGRGEKGGEEDVRRKRDRDLFVKHGSVNSAHVLHRCILGKSTTQVANDTERTMACPSNLPYNVHSEGPAAGREARDLVGSCTSRFCSFEGRYAGRMGVGNYSTPMTASFEHGSVSAGSNSCLLGAQQAPAAFERRRSARRRRIPSPVSDCRRCGRAHGHHLQPGARKRNPAGETGGAVSQGAITPKVSSFCIRETA